MKKAIFLGLVLNIISATSCGNKESNSYVIPEDKMIQVMADAQMAESYEKLGRENGIRNPSLLDSLYGLIYAKHQIDAVKFDSSLKYYSKQVQFPDMLESAIRINDEKIR